MIEKSAPIVGGEVSAVPRRHNGQMTARFQPKGRRAADDFTDGQRLSVELEDVAVRLTVLGMHGAADTIRSIARKYT